MPDIPSHIGEPVYPGVPLVSLPKSIPDGVLHIISNSVPKSVPVPISSLNDTQVSVSKDQSVDAPTIVGIKQESVSR